MKNLLTNSLKKFVSMLEKKGNNLDTLDNVVASINTLYGLGVKKGIGWLTALGSINYYNQISPIANAVDLISQKMSEIYVSVYDKKEKKYLKDTMSGTPFKVYNLLKKCDYDKTYIEYMIYQSSYFLITGNAFFVTQFIENGEPINLLLAKPQDITINGTGTSIPYQYIWNDGNRSITFTLDKTNFRYYGKDKAGFDYEIKHLKAFNPKYNNGNLWGLSKLTQIYLEMEQYIAGAVHNKKLLTNGSRPSGVLTINEEMSDDAYEKARAEVNSFYKGAENAGNILILEGDDAKFESFNLSPRDMDFANLSDRNVTAIYNRLNIPLPFISDKSMTYNNLSEALYQLYILAVLPLAELIFETLTDLIMYRYKDGDMFEIHYDEMDIDVLAQKKRSEDAETIKLGITTYNEARGMFSLEPLNEGGDDVFAPQNLIPLGQPIIENKDIHRALTDKENFINILKKQNFNEEEIMKSVEKIYGRD